MRFTAKKRRFYWGFIGFYGCCLLLFWRLKLPSCILISPSCGMGKFRCARFYFWFCLLHEGRFQGGNLWSGMLRAERPCAGEVSEAMPLTPVPRMQSLAGVRGWKLLPSARTDGCTAKCKPGIAKGRLRSALGGRLPRPGSRKGGNSCGASKGRRRPVKAGVNPNRGRRLSPLWRGDVAKQCITSPFSLFSEPGNFFRVACCPLCGFSTYPKTLGGGSCYSVKMR